MDSKPSSSHNVRNLSLCCFVSFLMFLIGSIQVLGFLISDNRLPRNAQLGTLSVELALAATLVISLIAIPLGYGYMFFFGGVLSTKAIKLYLFLTRGKTVITSKTADLEAIRAGKGWNLGLKRQLTYFGF